MSHSIQTARLSAEGLQTLMHRLSLILSGTKVGRLGAIVDAVAVAMRAEVCSIYLRRGQIIELFATHGLLSSAVHRVRLRLGEGLVGVIAKEARSLSVSDAFQHADFHYLPETGEEPFQSFHGVPILHGSECHGVLVVQHREPVHYATQDIETLSLIAAVIAEMAEANSTQIENHPLNRTAPIHMDCDCAAEGFATGKAVLHEPNIPLPNPISADPQKENKRLKNALQALQEEIATQLATPVLSAKGEHQDILDAYQLFAQDQAWQKRMFEAVDSGLAAEAAVEHATTELRTRLNRTNNNYLKERLTDLSDISTRLLSRLTGRGKVLEDLPKDSVLIARRLGPGELLQYPLDRLKAIVVEQGAANSHAAIIARTIGIPMLVSAHNATALTNQGDTIIVNGDHGHLHIRPIRDILNAYHEKIALQDQRLAVYRALRKKPTQTQDGTHIALHINAGITSDLASLKESGAEGIGLWRTELQYLARPYLPGREAQTKFYRNILDQIGDKPLIFRTMDIGADKIAARSLQTHESNPAMGWRGIRMGLDRPALLRAQLQALLRAANGRVLKIMFPMIAAEEEFFKARELLQSEITRLEEQNRPAPSILKVGAMLETPSLVYASTHFFQEVDFLSIGGNDLLQFFFASDRMNPRLTDRYDSLHPAFLRFLVDITQRCQATQTPLSYCGEAAGTPMVAITLAALGIHSLSMRPAAIGPVKEALCKVALNEIQTILHESLETNTSPLAALTHYQHF